MPENIGHVIQVAGPAVDVQFSAANMPPIYEALRVVSDRFKVPAPIRAGSPIAETPYRASTGATSASKSIERTIRGADVRTERRRLS